MSGSQVSEVRELADNQPHGFVRWGDSRKPASEEHFFRGKRHRIFREWEPDGRLRNGFPKFYVHDKLVTPARYKAAQAKDDFLPPYSERDDVNRRPLPEAVRDALNRAKALRRELALVAAAQRGTRVQ